MRSIATIILLLLTALLYGCSSTPGGGGYYMDDGPHANPEVDLERVPDAIPKVEPLSERGNVPYKVFNKTYFPLRDASGYRERGIASWYGKKFHGNRTSSGETYDMYAMTAAHKTLPIPSYARVRNLRNGESLIVRVNDRGPFLHNRLIDLSYAAAARLDIVKTGTGIVEVSAIAVDDNRKAYMPKKERVTPPSIDGQGPQIYLQVGAFSRRDNAAKLYERLRHVTPGPELLESDGANQEKVYKVRIGPIKTIEDVEQLTQRIADLGIVDAIFVID